MQRQYCNNIGGLVPEIKFIQLSSPNQQVFLPDLGELLILGEWERQINMLAYHAYILARACEGMLFVHLDAFIVSVVVVRDGYPMRSDHASRKVNHPAVIQSRGQITVNAVA